jgi:hypothetical protein
MHLLARLSLVAALTLGVSAAFSDDFWKSRKPDEWTEAEAQRMLSASPWAASVPYDYGVPGGQAPLSPSRVEGLEKVVRKPVAGVRWESALPIQEAMARLKQQPSPPALGGLYYVVSLTGLPPIDSLGDPARIRKEVLENTVLEPGGNPPISPLDVQFGKDASGPVLLLIFPKQPEIRLGDKTVTFRLRVRAVQLRVNFSLAEMQFGGKLEL